MANYIQFSQRQPVFHGKKIPENGSVVGYAAIIHVLELPVPMPDVWAIIAEKHTTYTTDTWKVLTPRHQPKENLYHQLVFALKYEGINLLLFKKLFEKLSRDEILELLNVAPTGQYTRKIWFLYEWLMQKELPIADLTIKNYVPLVDENLQYALDAGEKSSRHRIINNLPGTVDFCPLVRKTTELEAYREKHLDQNQNNYLSSINKKILQRASAFLLLKDSKASFSIEGESPKNNRAARWGKAIGQAGGSNLSHEELERLQQIIIENHRFVTMGYRHEGGFVGDRDPDTFSPIPDHISAKPADLDQLMTGLIASNKLLTTSTMDAVIAAACISFGFVFIHPFVDGNGRIHRYLIHHVLAQKNFAQQGIIFPVSAAILDRITDYRKTLERHSHPLLDYIDWQETATHNIKVTNTTIDYYRYFDATAQATFLYACVEDTINRIIPAEIQYLKQFESFKKYIDNRFEMPDDMVALLVHFLHQNQGRLSKRAQEKEFVALSKQEVADIESQFKKAFML